MSHLKSLGLRAPNYDKFPSIAVPPGHADSFWSGWESICSAILARTAALLGLLGRLLLATALGTTAAAAWGFGFG